ncbi:PepSY domain-containing protein [Bacillus sp. 1NLA3E]|uniref:PepSY domain-containing protein n=1 Tax=Bacillus sp. 1NLA3E TaxID=666686 RepID=UPI000247E59C|nr:PepSY domain-containing protein [Bacillus sp. 1NLA3E]
MNWKSFLMGVGSGLAGGITAYYLFQKGHTQTVTPEKVLEKIKTTFKEQGPILGSWIHMEAEPYVKDKIQYRVYKGGISKKVDDETKQFEFIADATTGTILSVQQL